MASFQWICFVCLSPSSHGTAFSMPMGQMAKRDVWFMTRSLTTTSLTSTMTGCKRFEILLIGLFFFFFFSQWKVWIVVDWAWGFLASERFEMLIGLVCFFYTEKFEILLIRLVFLGCKGLKCCWLGLLLFFRLQKVWNVVDWACFMLVEDRDTSGVMVNALAW